MTAPGKYLNTLKILLLISVAAFTGFLGLDAHFDLLALAPTASYQLIVPLNAGDYDAVKTRESRAAVPCVFALWGQTDAVWVQAADNHRKTSVAWLYIRGPAALVIPAARMLDEKDYSGCVLDQRTARNLFGHVNPIGAAIQIDGDAFTVRGVVPGPGRTVITAVRADSIMDLPHITIAGTGQGDAFADRHGLSPARFIQSGVYAAISRLVAALPALACIVIIIITLRKIQKNWRGYIVRREILFFLLFALSALLLCFVLLLLPQNLLPARWADFAFWSDSCSFWLNQASDWLYSAKLRPDLVYLLPVFKSGWGFVSACLLIRLHGLLFSRPTNR